MHARIFVTGASGFVAQALIPSLVQGGAQVFALVHKKKPEFQIDSEQAKERIVLVHSVQDMYSHLKNDGETRLDAVIHLAGAGIGDQPWTQHRKAVLQSSRWDLITRLHESLADLDIGFDRVLGASAVGYYGDCGDTLVHEQVPKGRGFAADLCEGVEQRIASAAGAQARWYALRLGIVLGPGGILARLAFPAKIGLGSTLGGGENWLSWIDRRDLVRAIQYVLSNDISSGPVNMVAPNPLIWREFSQELAQVFGRQSRIKVPSLLLAPLGEMKRLFLDSVRATPDVLLARGFRFEAPFVQGALIHHLGPK